MQDVYRCEPCAANHVCDDCAQPHPCPHTTDVAPPTVEDEQSVTQPEGD